MMNNERELARALQRADAAQLRAAMLFKLREADGDPEGDFVPPELGPIEDPAAFGNAADCWRRGDRREALVQLEYALGRDFDGLGALRPEDLA